MLKPVVSFLVLTALGVTGAAVLAAGSGRGSERDTRVVAGSMIRVADTADGHWYLTLSRPVLDPENNNRASRVVSLTVAVRHDKADTDADVPRQQSLSRLWIVPNESREALDAGSLGFGRTGKPGPAFLFAASIAPANGKTWGEVATRDDVKVRIDGTGNDD